MRPTKATFPDWVKTSHCRTYTRNVLIPTPHGFIRREVRITIPASWMVDKPYWYKEWDSNA